MNNFFFVDKFQSRWDFYFHHHFLQLTKKWKSCEFNLLTFFFIFSQIYSFIIIEKNWHFDDSYSYDTIFFLIQSQSSTTSSMRSNRKKWKKIHVNFKIFNIKILILERNSSFFQLKHFFYVHPNNTTFLSTTNIFFLFDRIFFTLTQKIHYY